MRMFGVALALAGASAIAAQEPGEWLAARQGQFAAWQSAHPDVESQLAALKARTAALIAAYVPPTAGPKYGDLTAQSARLTPARRADAQRYFARGREWFALGDYFSAREFFDLGLVIDPANTQATFYRAEIFRLDAERTGDPFLRAGYTAKASLYFDRVVTLAPASDEGKKAAEALKGLPRVTEEPEVNHPTVLWRVPGAPAELWDAPYAPPMVTIPAGEYTMGSLMSEDKMEITRADTEAPRHRVRIAYPLAVGKYPVTRAEFAHFLSDSGYDISKTVCAFLLPAPGTASWRNPGFPQTDNDPVVCMSHDNAEAYAAWLTRKTGHTYRLLSEAEFEYAARGGTATAYYWGDQPGQGHANCLGCGGPWDNKSTSPVGSFAPNPFGLYDMLGNAWTLVEDCYNYSYAGAPADGSAWREGNCATSVERGGNFNQSASASRASYRGGRASMRARGLNIHSFRVARVL